MVPDLKSQQKAENEAWNEKSLPTARRECRQCPIIYYLPICAVSRTREYFKLWNLFPSKYFFHVFFFLLWLGCPCFHICDEAEPREVEADSTMAGREIHFLCMLMQMYCISFHIFLTNFRNKIPNSRLLLVFLFLISLMYIERKGMLEDMWISRNNIEIQTS